MKQEKKYLKTIEEVSDALAAGKVLYNRYGQKIWKDKNGFIVCKAENDTQYLNTGGICVRDEPYILEPKPLEVKLWHLYENGKGEKVFIGAKHTDAVPYPFCGMTEKVFITDFYNKNGKASEIDSQYDLVKEIADLSQYFEKENK